MIDKHQFGAQVALQLDELNQLTFMNQIKPRLALAARGRHDLITVGLATIARRVREDGSWDTMPMVENGFDLAFEFGRQMSPAQQTGRDAIMQEAAAVRDAVADWANKQGKSADFRNRLGMFSKLYGLSETSTAPAPVAPDDNEALRRRLAAAGLVMPTLGGKSRR